MKKLLIKRSLISLSFVFASFIVEAFLFLFLGWGLLPKYFFIDFTLIFLIGAALFVIPWHWLSSLISTLFVVIFILLSYANIMLLENLNIPFSWDLIHRAADTQEVTNKIITPVIPIVYYGIVLVAFVIGLVFISKIKSKDSKINKILNKIVFNLTSSVVLALTMAFSTIQIKTLNNKSNPDLYILSDKYQYETFENPMLSIRRFGLSGYYFNDAFNRLFPKVVQVAAFDSEPLREYNPSIDSVLWSKAQGNNLIMIVAESFEWFAISPELTPTLYALANGYDLTGVGINQFYEKHKQEDGFTKLIRKDYELNNSGTGSFYKKNDIDIYEGLDPRKVGLKLENYFSKSFTDGAESSSIGDILNYNNFYERDYLHTLPHMLKDSNAVKNTNYLHTYAGDYYERDTRMPAYGFNNILFGNELPEIVGWERNLSKVVLDSKAVDYCLNFENSGFDFITENESFMTMIMTVTTHVAYEYAEKFEDNYKFFDSIDSSVDDDWEAGSSNQIKTYLKSDDDSMNETIRNYLSKALDTEHMVALIVDDLIQKNIFDKTTLVFFADHNTHVNDISFNYKNLYYRNYSKLSSYVNNVPAFIYSTSIVEDELKFAGYANGGVIKKLTSSHDFTPTILTLFGIQFNPNYYLGYPVLCNSGGYELGSDVYISSGYYTTEIYSLDGLIPDFKLKDTSQESIKKMSYDIVRQYNKKKYIEYLSLKNAFKSYNQLITEIL